MIRFRLLGNWAGALSFFNNLPGTVKKASLDSQKDVAEKLQKIVKGHIKANDLDFEPLATSTVKRKGHSIIFIDNYDYLRAITIWKDGNTYHCGIKKSSRNSKGESIYKIANILEYGASTAKGEIPARPLWKLSVKELGGREGIRKTTEKLIKARLRILNSKHTFDIH